ncbi:MAG: pilin [Patescibacteria group bacterium]|nr:pilin [Patescibacteria group bacterium]MDD4610572.1 pilin [Patescibacteria group bacterium]
MQISKKIFIVSLIFGTLILGQFLFLASAPVASAEQSLWSQQVGKTELQNTFGAPQDIRVIIAKLIKIMLGLLGIIFIVLIIYSGFKYMTSQGNEEQVKESVNTIKRAVIGLIIILAAYSITQFVTDCLLDITSGYTVWMCK